MSLLGILNGKGKETINTKEEQYGRAWRLIVGQKQREKGFSIFRELSNNGFAEATIALSMFTQTMEERKNLISKIVPQKHPEALWQMCNLIPHTFYPDLENESNARRTKMCLDAAEMGSVDAMNEMGNICHRLGQYAESMYWYAMAQFNDHPDGKMSMQFIARKWEETGMPKEYSGGTPRFNKARFRAALTYLELYNELEPSTSLHILIQDTLEGEPLSGYLTGDLFEQQENYEMAYKMYNALAFENDGHGLKCYADMLYTGRGVQQDLNSAVRTYKLAAENGDRAAMFITGEFTKQTNQNLAAYWYGVSHTRGYPYSLERLITISE